MIRFIAQFNSKWFYCIPTYLPTACVQCPKIRLLLNIPRPSITIPLGLRFGCVVVSLGWVKIGMQLLILDAIVSDCHQYINGAFRKSRAKSVN